MVARRGGVVVMTVGVRVWVCADVGLDVHDTHWTVRLRIMPSPAFLNTVS